MDFLKKLLLNTDRPIRDCRRGRQGPAPKWDRKYASELKFARYGCRQSRSHKDRVLKMSWRSNEDNNHVKRARIQFESSDPYGEGRGRVDVHYEQRRTESHALCFSGVLERRKKKTRNQ
jgi:hypothetical protein